MQYEQLSQDYRDDYLAEALYAREMEWFQYEFDAINFEHMLRSLPPESPYYMEIQQHLDGTRKQQWRSEKVMDALRAQITDEERHKAAVERTRAKREAK